MKYKTITASLLLSVTLANPVLGVVSVARAQEPRVPQEIIDTEVERTLDKLSEIKDDSRGVKLQETAEDIITQSKDLEVEIPKDSDEPIVLKSKGNKPEISITLPETQSTEEAEQISGNMVAYESEDTFSNIVQPTEDGVRFMTIIQDSSAPTEYKYDLSVEGDYILTEAINSEGEKGIIIMNLDQSDIIAIINPAWAKDASGKDIPTWFEIRDNELIQHVNHRISGVVYPVTADPYIWGNYYENYWWGSRVWFKKYHSAELARHLNFGGEVPGIAAAAICGKYGAGVYGAVGCGLLSWAIGGTLGWWADGVINRGNCIGVTQRFTSFWFWEWNNQHCW